MRALERLPGRWDIVLVDCPPSLGYLAIAPLTVCQEALVPVEAHYMALAGVTSLVETMDQIRVRLNPGLKLGGVLACRVNRTMHAHAVVARLRQRYPEAILRTQIRESIRLAEAPSFRLPITSYAPESAGAEDYRALAEEMFEPAKAHARVTKRIAADEPDRTAPAATETPTVGVASPFDQFRQVFRRTWPATASPGPETSGAADEAVGKASAPER